MLMRFQPFGGAVTTLAFLSFLSWWKGPILIVGLSNLTQSLKVSGVKLISNASVLHPDLALRNIVQSRTDPNKAKIVDFGRAVITDDNELLENQVESMRHMLGLEVSSPPQAGEVISSFQPLPV